VNSAFESRYDNPHVIAFFPSIGGEIALAFAVGARIHHHDAIAGAKKKISNSQIAGSIIRNAMK
jgi:hypothetical protein